MGGNQKCFQLFPEAQKTKSPTISPSSKKQPKMLPKTSGIQKMLLKRQPKTLPIIAGNQKAQKRSRKLLSLKRLPLLKAPGNYKSRKVPESPKALKKDYQMH